jgi:hypothetical protein
VKQADIWHDWQDIIAGFWGFSHTRFGGPGEKTPIMAEQDLACGHSFVLRNPSGCIVGDS